MTTVRDHRAPLSSQWYLCKCIIRKGKRGKWHNKSGIFNNLFSSVGTGLKEFYCTCTRVQLKSRLPTQCNLNGHSMTTPLPMLSPRTVLLPPSPNGTFISALKNLVCISIPPPPLSLKLCKSEIANCVTQKCVMLGSV